ncbi:MAG: hypothetical protein J5943_10960 [Oribacterium sp.]|nr:hypothetical protein [Oribacterium sp.]MBP3803259.1 hypothetical protein [Oribacterium sp.]
MPSRPKYGRGQVRSHRANAGRK